MKPVRLTLLLAGIAVYVLAPARSVAQSPSEQNWIGIWHPIADAQPTGTLTVAADTGQLGGTVVMNGICCEGESEHVVVSEPHVLMNIHADSTSLSFDIKRKKPDGAQVVATFKVTSESGGKAAIQCVSCGPHPPVVELTRN